MGESYSDRDVFSEEDGGPKIDIDPGGDQVEESSGTMGEQLSKEGEPAATIATSESFKDLSTLKCYVCNGDVWS